MRRLLRLPLTAMLIAGACARPADEPASSTPAADPADLSAPAIDWQDWDPAAFERARREHSLILVDIGIEGCTACRWMDERTYRHPAVARRLVDHFVTIQVDAEARPDIGERYSAWGWPATIVMSPEGEQVLAIRGNKLPRNFIPILDQLLEAHQAGTLGRDGEAPLWVPPEPDPAELGQLRRRVRRAPTRQPSPALDERPSRCCSDSMTMASSSSTIRPSDSTTHACEPCPEASAATSSPKARWASPSSTCTA